MKKLITAGLMLWASSTQVLADAASDLQQRLSALGRFSADFSQQVYDESGAPMQRAEGSMQLARPDRFRWHTTSPDESLIVSDGTDVWMYDPFVEQVSILPLAQAVKNTPFLLISGADRSRWQGYKVSQQGSSFVVTSKDPAELIQRFTLRFDNQGRLSRFTVVESGGQRSEFTLSRFNTSPTLAASAFRFTPPPGVMVDDQR
ncbi:outer membrane lipoprotein chaperone LolA [Oceanimonas pelagia]|uniref:Outer-membrane lipoprotein carrier protein n=2 Tax=Oceanimonas TaxID=129577 RepID=A0A233RI61_9GAMM|nr:MULTISPECIES: outer membrane lipoprotein chaperone LolA [Oceanimonas]OXY83079.1 outer membrane lipoprotein carrier protein LolA [Oceanimonas doudoroffii]WMC11458.1 outer membrane lipoprotein chaperone LolA [Oceanimonas pelagia]